MTEDAPAPAEFPDNIEELKLVAGSLLAALVFENDSTIGAAIRRQAGLSADKTLVVKLPMSPAGLEIEQSGTIRPVRQYRYASALDLEAYLREDPSLDLRYQGGRQRLRQQVSRILRPFIGISDVPSRAEFEAIFRWAPIIEVAAYSFVARAISYLDRIRQIARQEIDSGSAGEAAQSYYRIVNMMAYFSLISSQPMAGTWLGSMARSFTWTRWTPSFALTRERTVWLAAAGAKTAAAFGPVVIEPYHETLSHAAHAFNIFDALFGLTAIALAHPEVRHEIIEIVASEELALFSKEVIGAEFAAAAFRSSLLALNSQVSGAVTLERLGWSSDGQGDGLASHQAFRLDPCEINSDGVMLGFAALPAVMAHGEPGHFPRSKGRAPRLRLGPKDISAIMMRAWASAGSTPSRTLH